MVKSKAKVFRSEQEPLLENRQVHSSSCQSSAELDSSFPRWPGAWCALVVRPLPVPQEYFPLPERDVCNFPAKAGACRASSEPHGSPLLMCSELQGLHFGSWLLRGGLRTRFSTATGVPSASLAATRGSSTSRSPERAGESHNGQKVGAYPAPGKARGGRPEEGG